MIGRNVAQQCLTLCNPMDCSLPSSSVHGIFQATVLEWIAISFSSRSSWSGLPFPSPADLPDPRIKPWSPTLQTDALLSEPPGKSQRLSLLLFNQYMHYLCSFEPKLHHIDENVASNQCYGKPPRSRLPGAVIRPFPGPGLGICPVWLLATCTDRSPGITLRD